MVRYPVQPIEAIFEKGFGFFLLAKNMGHNVSKNISKNLSDKYSQKLLDHAKQSATDTLKTNSKRVIQKTAEASGDLICNQITDRITKVSKTLSHNNPEAITNEHNKEIPKERYIYI